MSLKAKFEAVIYAAEEPVTLTQLATLFAEDLTPVEELADPVAQQAEFPVEATEASAPEDSVSLPAPGDAEPVAADSVGAAPAPVSAKAKSESAAARATQRKLRDAAKLVVDELIADYAAEGDGADGRSARGMEIREVAGGYRMSTKPEYHDAVRGFIKGLKPPLKLSLPALETLAVIAYKQPVTSPEIGEIRGVDSAGVLGGLLARKLITTAGRKQVLGRPILYKTTQEFLLRFGLKDVQELPSLQEFEKMAAEITEFDDAPSSPQQAAREQAALAEAEYSEPGEVEPQEAEPAPQTAETDSLAVEVEEEQAQP